MRIVVTGATSLGVAAARRLIDAGCEVVIVDADRARLDALGEELDCGLIQGDGTLPSTLRDAYGDGADALLTLTEHDENNVLSALIGRSIGFPRVIPRILNPELRPICRELELKEAVFTDETIASRLIESLRAESADDRALTAGEGLRLLRIAASEETAGPLEALDLPDGARLVAVEREGDARLDDEIGEIREDDRLVFLARPEAVGGLRERFGPARPAEAAEDPP